MVDTGATLTVLPPRIAEEIGVPRLPMMLKLELADVTVLPLTSTQHRLYPSEVLQYPMKCGRDTPD